MKLQEIIEQVFLTNIYDLKPLHKGLTNKNYLLNVNDNTYVVRVPWENSEHIVNRIHEKKTMQAIHNLNLDVPTIYFDEQTGIKITKYIHDLYEFHDCPYPDKIQRAALLMKQLHQAKLNIDHDFDPLERYRMYHRHVHDPIYDVRPYESIIKEIQMISTPHILCHNDWVSGNILFSKQRDYLIDFEYAADNDPLFDVMSFITENNINNEQERQLFYEVYFEDMHDDIKEKLRIWEVFHNLLWCTWAMMMWEQRHELVYKEIAEMKYQALQRSALA